MDGLRALSILLVLYGHLSGTEGYPEALRKLPRVVEVAELGVRVFFVLSGYLITTLLVAERRKTGTVRLGNFYARRVFRIFPAYYCFLGVMALASFFGALSVPGIDFVVAAAYLTNFRVRRAWHLGHSWSLAVEEQFYLLWPAIFKKTGERRGLYVALAVVFLAPFVRIAWAYVSPSKLGRDMIGEAFPTVADALATGCALSLLGPRLSKSARYLKWLRSPVVLVGALFGIALSVWMTRHHPWISWASTQSLACVCIALVIDRYSRYPGGPIGRILNLRPLAFLGALSYSLYLWQQPFLVPKSIGGAAPFWVRFPQNIGFAFAFALLSYFLVEKPFLRLRDRALATNRSPSQ